MSDTPQHNEPVVLGKTLGNRYQVEVMLGEGGMGKVFRAVDTQLDRKVVLKVPRYEFLADAEFQARFQREIESLIGLDHPHVVKVIDVIEYEGVPIVVLQYLAGGDLDARIKYLKRRFSPTEVLEWLPQVASALDFIHRHGFVHRDVKPGNILFDKSGFAFLGDFGVVRTLSEGDDALTRTGLTPGSPRYMAPEAALGLKSGPAYDQYSLAVVVYFALAGETPHDADTPMAIVTKKAMEPPKQLSAHVPSLPPGVATAVMKALARDAGDRFATCSDFAKAFRRAAEATSDATAASPEVTAKSSQPSSDRTITLGAVAAPRRRGRKRVLFLMACTVAAAAFAAFQARQFIEDDAGLVPVLGEALERTARAVSTPAEAESPERRDADSAPAVSALAALQEQDSGEVTDAAGTALEESVVGEPETLAAGGDVDVAALTDAAGAESGEQPDDGSGGEVVEGEDSLDEESSSEPEQGPAAVPPSEVPLEESSDPVDPAPASEARQEAPADVREETRTRQPEPEPEPTPPPPPTREETIAALLNEAKQLASSRQVGSGGRDAIVVFREVLDLDSTNADALGGLRNIQDYLLSAARGAEERGQEDKARSLYRRAASVLDDEEANSSLAVFEARTGQQAEAARELPEDPPTQQERAEPPAPEEAEAAPVETTVRRQLEAPQLDTPEPSAQEPTSQEPSSSRGVRKDGAEMVHIPGGNFVMGRRQGGSNEQPLRQVALSAYKIDKHEVTWAQYRDYMKANDVMTWKFPSWNPSLDHPVVNVTWDEAVAYCEWVGGRLPTEAEWEFAARGAAGLGWPWGNRWEVGRVNWSGDEDGHPFTAPVTAFPEGASPFGLLNMSGNVSEWVADWYSAREYASGPARDPKGPSNGVERVQRGGAFNDSVPGSLTGSRRRHQPPSSRAANWGFRCAADAP